ncbi:MMM1 (YLL006W) [Zygosaccharomyces parabailii]|nr:MMM1 (YLL006W) [Zygosaccharomyces parabailii]CDH14752.1 probable Maintenance of mitochondrial morphology protein 1 [Zygosaccharomyces bailii ISA1307]
MESNYSTIGDNLLSNGTVAMGNGTLISVEDYLNQALPIHLEALLQNNSRDSLLNVEGVDKADEFERAGQDPENNILSFKALLSDLLRQQNQNIGSAVPLALASSPSSFSSWSFAQGLVVGQLSVVLVLIFFIKFFIFSDSSSKPNPNPAKNTSNLSTESRSFISPHFFTAMMNRKGNEQVESTDDDNERSRQINDILEKTYYNVDTHPAESLDWFNVLIGQTIQQLREEAWQKDNIVYSLNAFIERKAQELPSYLDSIKITELDIGHDFPIFSNCRIQYSPNSNRKKLEAKIDIDLNDRLAVGIETRLLLNYPKPATASLPVNVTVSIIRFQACLTVSLTKAEEFVRTSPESMEENSDTGYFLMFSFAPEYRMEFETQSLIGARSKLENIPKIGSLVEHQIKKWFVERCVEPRFQFIKLPSVWPRSKNTREGKSDLDDSDSLREAH